MASSQPRAGLVEKFVSGLCLRKCDLKRIVAPEQCTECGEMES